jgi:putative phage-type endonuclease
MKSHIRLVPTKDMTQEQWLQYRKQGIGASEVGVIMGLSPYKASIQLFYEKIGEALDFSLETLARFLGKEQEPFIARLWEYWEHGFATTKEGQENMIRNYRGGKKVRRCHRVNAYAHNPKYPWLFCSLDREINRHGPNDNGALELKTIGGYEVDKWETGIPPVMVFQVQTQMLVCEYDYGEIAILKDNREFFVLPFEFNTIITDSIVETTKTFWDKVEKGRQIINARFEAERTFNYAMAQELNAELQTIEPEPDGSEAFNSYLKEKYKIALPGERIGNAEQLADAQAHKEVAGRIKELETEKQLHENRLKNALGHEQADRFDFGANGYVSWKADTNGVRRFLNKTK